MKEASLIISGAAMMIAGVHLIPVDNGASALCLAIPGFMMILFGAAS